jgi:LysR family transcriptional regulator, transcription activator of glutamate synthase operon
MLLLQCLSGMELRQLRYLTLLAEELSFTRAAARANVAQPALSRQIRNLEDELGTPLVDRTSRRVRMTLAGQGLVERATLILTQVDEARADIQGMTRLLSGRLSIGVTRTPGPVDVAALLCAFHDRHPGVELEVSEELSAVIADRLRADELELGLISGVSDQLRRGLELEQIAHEPLVVIVPASHPLAAGGELDARELGVETLVVFPPRATIRETVEAVAADAGVRPRVMFETSDTNRMRELVSIGLGVGILPLSDATRPGPPVATTTLRGNRPEYRMYLARRSRRRLSPAALAMAALIADRYETRTSAASENQRAS